MSYILGINISHNPSVCLLKDGEVVFYGEEPGFQDYKSVDDVSCVHLQSILDITKTIDDVIFSSYRKDNYLLEQDIINSYINSFIHSNISYKYVHFFPTNHHIYHAMKSLRDSTFTEATAVISDGSGTFLDAYPSYQEIESIYAITANSLRAIYKHYSSYRSDAINQFFPRLKPLISFINVFEGQDRVEYLFSNKLSAGHIFTEVSCTLFKESTPNPKKLMELSTSSKKVFDTSQYTFLIDGCPYLNINNDQVQEIASQLAPPEDIAKQVQFETLEHTCNLIQKAIDMTDQKNIILSGGYFLNSINNLEYPKRFPDINFYIDPKAHDGGTAVGAAYYLYKLQNNFSYGKQP